MLGEYIAHLVYEVFIYKWTVFKFRYIKYNKRGSFRNLQR